MLPRKSLTVSPLSVLVVTFLKADPAFCPAGGAAGTCAAAGPAHGIPISNTTIPTPTASITRLDQGFIVYLSFRKVSCRCGSATVFRHLTDNQYTSGPG